MWDIFRKKSDTNDNQKAGMIQRLAMKKMASMSPAEKNNLMRDMLKPENRGKLLSAMEQMKKTGMITDAQIEEANKKKMGL